MRVVPHYFSSLLGNFIVTSLLTCMLTSAFDINFSPRSLSSHFFKRSIPGSFATAPQGAVGYYQPPPGPVIDSPPPSHTTTTAPQELHHELRQEPTSSGISLAEYDSQKMATVTTTKTVVVETSGAIGSKEVVLSTSSLSLSALLSLYLL